MRVTLGFYLLVYKIGLGFFFFFFFFESLHQWFGKNKMS